MDFFEGIFNNLVGTFQNSDLSKSCIISKVFLKEFDHRLENFYGKNNSFKGTLTKNIEMLRFLYFFFIII